MRVKCNRCSRKKSENDAEISKKEELKKKQKAAQALKQNSKNSCYDKSAKDKNTERAGDWVCVKCKNSNFSFRVVCNRCQLSKAESEKLFELHMNNLAQIGKMNENIQNQLQKQMMYEHNLQVFYNNISNNCGVLPMYLV